VCIMSFQCFCGIVVEDYIVNEEIVVGNFQVDAKQSVILTRFINSF